jgi:hypothetical protein
MASTFKPVPIFPDEESPVDDHLPCISEFAASVVQQSSKTNIDAFSADSRRTASHRQLIASLQVPANRSQSIKELIS